MIQLNKRRQCTACGVNGTVGKASLIQLCQKIKNIYNKWEKSISLPFSTKLGPFFDVHIVLFFGAPSPGGQEQVGSWLWNSLRLIELPDNRHATILSLVFRGCSIPLWGSVSKSLCWGRLTGVAMRRLNSCGHQACVGHRDTTMRASALSLSNFFRHLAIKQKGGNRWANIPVHAKEKASTWLAPGSGFQEAYLSNWEFNLEAKRSVPGVPQILEIFWKTSYLRCHSVRSLT